MTRISVFITALVCMLQISAASPNVILILTDDQGLGDMSFYGNPVLETPHLDKLATTGVHFDQFHVTSMCSPTRGALLTGLNPLQNGAISTCQGQHSVDPALPTLPQAFADAGYATGIFGKWHLGRNWPNRPVDKGFQENFVLYGFGTTGISSRWNNDYQDSWVVHNGKDIQTEGFCTDVFFDRSMTWMKEQQQADKPFFAYISTNAPHFPFWAPKELAEKYKDTDNPEFFAMMENLDDNMGRLAKFLKTEGLERDTIVVFLTDNGPVGGRSTYTAGLKGGKATPWEAGHRVPLLVRYPGGGLEGGVKVMGLADVTDLFPTLLDLCGVKTPADTTLTGISLAPAMRQQAQLPDRTLIMNIQQRELSPKSAAVMKGKWRVLWSDALYDLEADPTQDVNVAAQHPEMFYELWSALQKYYGENEVSKISYHPEFVGSPHQEVVVLDASSWMGKRADGQASVRNAVGRDYDAQGGAWRVKAFAPGKYRVALRRWPEESGLALSDSTAPFQTQLSGKPLPEGKALPIDHATLDINGRRYRGKATEDPGAVVFEVEVGEGEMDWHGVFRDREGNPLCGAFYAYVSRIL